MTNSKSSNFRGKVCTQKLTVKVADGWILATKDRGLVLNIDID